MPVLNFTVNGIPRTVHLEEGRVMLSSVLRDCLGLTGTKVGCGTGQCGSCTVVMNGSAVTSCTVPAEKCEGSEVLTIEALAEGGVLHPIQQAFVDAGAIQCGFCTPGLIMRLYALLTANPEAGDEILEAEINKHLCRCTGYETILAAARLARERMTK
ncbi:(2Fe-2S)-binding protein [Aminivibrio sp.]|jgi:carbon-monoxide dehydrogenase small subunit|uniref:(2Fe-2S)-binding protein n=1 Tax=Aminivibrio sp. TaxID=1872489 RepID=UPI001A51AFC5|nr:(2Fe-2S)-binding protein [Aminivibrio sp.]MBL3539987.1 (2Fe-2S)-binding protein [Aminivibrio sp.]MDK2959099.1 aerobic carbon-monoxide dehydrogenase small subunit [Synergistaceae bacterium]